MIKIILNRDYLNKGGSIFSISKKLPHKVTQKKDSVGNLIVEIDPGVAHDFQLYDLRGGKDIVVVEPTHGPVPRARHYLTSEIAHNSRLHLQ